MTFHLRIQPNLEDYLNHHQNFLRHRLISINNKDEGSMESNKILSESHHGYLSRNLNTQKFNNTLYDIISQILSSVYNLSKIQNKLIQ